MIAKMLRPMIQVNLPCSILMKSRSLHKGTKTGFMIFFTVTLRPFMNYHSSPLFPSRNITDTVTDTDTETLTLTYPLCVM